MTVQVHSIDRSPISWGLRVSNRRPSTTPAAAADIRGLMPGLETVLQDLAARFTEAAAAG